MPRSPLSESDRIKLGHQLFTSRSWDLIPDVLREMDTEAVRSLRNPAMNPEEHISTLRFTNKFRDIIRSTAHASGVSSDPFA